MSGSDAQSMQIPCPARPACRGKLELRRDYEPTSVRCPKCKGVATVAEFARTGELRYPVIPDDMPRGMARLAEILAAVERPRPPR